MTLKRDKRVITEQPNPIRHSARLDTEKLFISTQARFGSSLKPWICDKTENGTEKVAYLVTICSCHQIVNVFHKESLQRSILLPLDILQVIRVNNTNNMIKFISPPFTMMVPVQMFWFLKDSNISLLWWNKLGSISSRYYTTPFLLKLNKMNMHIFSSDYIINKFTNWTINDL